MLGYKPSEEAVVDRTPKMFTDSSNGDQVDWVKAGAVTPVKDQGYCGSCWAFSATGALEGKHFVESGNLVSFSEQQLVSCASLSYGNHGCSGGWQYNAFKYWEDYNAETEEAYPYSTGTYLGYKVSCHYDASSTTDVSVSAYDFVTPKSVSQLKAALAQAPVAVVIEASHVFQYYKSGILDDASCGTTLDHAVLLVGWGYDDGLQKDFWLVKNSWNTTWGDNGYIRIAIVDGDGICGIQMEPQTVTSN